MRLLPINERYRKEYGIRRVKRRAGKSGQELNSERTLFVLSMVSFRFSTNVEANS